jgi:predicted nucleic acid-binding protein
MAVIVDSSVWVGCVRTDSPEPLRRQTKAIIMGPDSLLCEPVLFELLRAVPKRNRARTEALVATVPILSTPADLWVSARILGQKCIDAGSLPPAIDLLIAQIGLHHNVPITTFDSHFQQIAKVSSLQVNFLMRAKEARLTNHRCRLILPIPCSPDRGPFPPFASAATFARGFRLTPALTLSSPTRDPFSKLHCRHEAGSDSSGYRDLPENFVEQRWCPLAA